MDESIYVAHVISMDAFIILVSLTKRILVFIIFIFLWNVLINMRSAMTGKEEVIFFIYNVQR